MKITLMALLLFVLSPVAIADSDAAPEKAAEDSRSADLDLAARNRDRRQDRSLHSHRRHHADAQ